MKHPNKKKKRPQIPSNNKTQVGKSINEKEKSDQNEKRAVNGLMEAFVSVSLNEAISAYKEANGDANKAAEILVNFVSEDKKKGLDISSTSSGSSSVNGDRWRCVGEEAKDKKKKKKVVAATGMVSSVIGRDYVSKATPKKDSKFKGYDYEPVSKVDAEQFLCSMLGEDCELSLAVVRDVLCQCGYDVQKVRHYIGLHCLPRLFLGIGEFMALNTLLELCASSYESSNNGQTAESFAESKEEGHYSVECTDNLTDRASDLFWFSETSDSTSHTSENESQDNEWTASTRSRNYAEVLTGSGILSKVGAVTPKSELPEELLKAFFKMPQRSEYEPHSMNWKDVVKKMETLGQKFDSAPPSVAEPEIGHAKGDEYQVYRKAATQHWDAMKSCYHKAAAAFSNGEREYASYLSEQGRLSNKMAQEADEKASKEIFRARNKSIENIVTIDLHGQHVKQAMRLLKVHLLFGVYACSIQNFRVITGCGGKNGMGKSKVKHSVIDLVQREGIEWKEENHGTILIKLDGQREFSFLELDDSD